MIELKDVSKIYNGKVIFEDVNLTIRDGEVTAFVEHNGRGKSTLLKAISGLVRIDRGDIIYDRNYRFSYVPEKFPVIHLSAIDFLMHMAEIDGIYAKNDRLARIHALAKDFYAENMLDKPMKNLSKGTLQKIGVIQALMSDPEMRKAENGYYLVSDERMLSHEINRLQKEGWHIGKVYEADKHDEVSFT